MIRLILLAQSTLSRCHATFAQTLRNITACRKRAVNGKVQGSAATHLRGGGVVNKLIVKDSLPSLSAKKNNFKIGEYLAKLQART